MAFKVIDAEGNEVELTAENLPKAIKDSIIKEAQALVYSNIDSRVTELFGAQKNAGEKTSDFISRVIKSKEEEIETLKKGSPEVANLQQDIQKLKETNLKLKGDLDRAGKEFSEKLTNEYVKTQIMGLQITVPSHLTEKSEIEAYIADQRDLLTSKFNSKYYVKVDDQGNKKIFNKSDNSPVADDNLTEIPLVDVVKRDNAYLFKEAPAKTEGQAGGTGQNGKPSGQGSGYKSFEDISAAAIKAGHAAGSPAYTEFVSKASTESGIEF